MADTYGAIDINACKYWEALALDSLGSVANSVGAKLWIFS